MQLIDGKATATAIKAEIAEGVGAGDAAYLLHGVIAGDERIL